MGIIQNNTPVGTIIAHGGDSAPSGFLLCDGSPISRTAYPNLFQSISTNWGWGDNSTTFNVPDLRGTFLRGVDRGRGFDPESSSRFQYFNGGNTGDQVGSNQLHALASHSHLHYTDSALNGSSPNTGSLIASGNNSPTSFTGGPETRPSNSYVNYFIKF
jgi:microcystin-dependent protein